MTAAELWLALTAQGHDVDMAGCERIYQYRNLWVSTRKGAYLVDQSLLGVDFGDTFWLIKDGTVQEVEPEMFKRGWKEMRSRGEV